MLGHCFFFFLRVTVVADVYFAPHTSPLLGLALCAFLPMAGI